MCWIWHNWAKWETVMLRWVPGTSLRTVVVGEVKRKGDDEGNYGRYSEAGDVVGQQRTCATCGKTAIREVTV